jgi:hypothetical protein
MWCGVLVLGGGGPVFVDESAEDLFALHAGEGQRGSDEDAVEAFASPVPIQRSA